MKSNSVKIIPSKIIALLILSIIISSCSNKNYSSISNSDLSNIKVPVVFASDFVKALYKTRIQIYGNELTGVTLIKKTDSTYRVVSMSEMGLKYFDFEFSDNSNREPKVHYIMKPLDKKLLVNMFLRDFDFLFHSPRPKATIKSKSDNITEIIDGKIIYRLTNEGVISHISKSRCLLKDKELVNLSTNYKSNPDSILFDHGKVNYQLIEITK